MPMIVKLRNDSTGCHSVEGHLLRNLVLASLSSQSKVLGSILGANGKLCENLVIHDESGFNAHLPGGETTYAAQAERNPFNGGQLANSLIVCDRGSVSI